MKLKKSQILILSAISANALATEVESKPYKIQGEISYNYSDYDNENFFMNNDTRLSGSYISISGESEFLTDTFTVIDVGAGQNNDFVLDDFDQADKIDFEINQILIKGKKEDFDLRFGRMFTPMGFYHEDELNVNNFFDSSNDVTRFMDGLDIGLSHLKNNDSFKANVFIGTRLDNADVSTIFGGNVIFSRAGFGHFNLGYASVSLSEPLVYTPRTVLSNDIETADLTYFYDGSQLNFVIKGEHKQTDEMGEIQEIYSKISYRFNRFIPYIGTTITKISPEEELAMEDETLSYYTGGMDMELSQNLTLYGEYSYFKTDNVNDHENLYRAGLKFEY